MKTSKTKTPAAKPHPDEFKIEAAAKALRRHPHLGRGRGLTTPMLRLLARAYAAGFDAGFDAAELLNR